jgi:hypothetical protein
VPICLYPGLTGIFAPRAACGRGWSGAAERASGECTGHQAEGQPSAARGRRQQAGVFSRRGPAAPAVVAEATPTRRGAKHCKQHPGQVRPAEVDRQLWKHVLCKHICEQHTYQAGQAPPHRAQLGIREHHAFQARALAAGGAADAWRAAARPGNTNVVHILSRPCGWKWHWF